MKTKFNRREFMSLGSLTLASLALPKMLNAQSCLPKTSKDRYGLGPFYLPDAPSRIELASDSEPGERIQIDGCITDCNGPLENMQIEVWQAIHQRRIGLSNSFPMIRIHFRLESLKFNFPVPPQKLVLVEKRIKRILNYKILPLI